MSAPIKLGTYPFVEKVRAALSQGLEEAHFPAKGENSSIHRSVMAAFDRAIAKALSELVELTRDAE